MESSYFAGLKQARISLSREETVLLLRHFDFSPAIFVFAVPVILVREMWEFPNVIGDIEIDHDTLTIIAQIRHPEGETFAISAHLSGEPMQQRVRFRPVLVQERINNTHFSAEGKMFGKPQL